MDKLPMCLWMLLFPSIDFLSDYVKSKWMTREDWIKEQEHDKGTGGVLFVIWLVGALILYPL